jgi:hypothetical protein
MIKNEIEIGWDYSEKEIYVEKNHIKFTIYLNDYGGVYFQLTSSSSDDDKQNLYVWASIIAEKVEKSGSSFLVSKNTVKKKGFLK